MTTYDRTHLGAIPDLASSGVSGSEIIVVTDDDSNKSACGLTITNLASFLGTTFLSATGVAGLTTTDTSMFVGLSSVLKNTVGTWTITRIAQGDMSYRHTAAAETNVMVVDVTPEVRAAASHGFKLTSFNVIHKIGTANMTAHTVTFNQIVYSNNVANAVTQPAISGSLSTATQSNPYVDTITITSPAYLNTAAAKYVIEYTQNLATTTAFDYYGTVLNFTYTL